MFKINNLKQEYTDEDLKIIHMITPKLTPIAKQLGVDRKYLILPAMMWVGVELLDDAWIIFMQLKQKPLNWSNLLCNLNIDEQTRQLIINSQNFVYDNNIWS